jgi:hypothetical protein
MFLKSRFNKTDAFFKAIIFLSFLFFIILPRTVPSIKLPDRGIFVSVAERLLAGDKLYSEVWENKDPIFYWLIALGRFFSPFADIVLEVLYIFIASTSIYFISRYFDLIKNSAFIIGFVACPIIITGGNYYPGYSHLPGTALTLASLMLLLYDRSLLSGLLFSFTLFTKLTTAPILISMLFVVLLLDKTHKKLSLCVGIISGAVIPVLGLWFRGELQGYLSNFSWNLTYANENLYPSWPRPIAHILKSSNSISLSLSLIVILILISEYYRLRNLNYTQTHKIAWMLLSVTFISFLTSYVILSFTGLWDHHNQILYIPGLLSLIISTRFIEIAFKDRSHLKIIVLVVSAILLSGPKPSQLFVTYQEMKLEILSLNSLSPEASAMLTVAKPGTYARIGTNDDSGHAYGLREFKLACPYFHLYPSAPISEKTFFKKTLDCLPTVETVIISSTFTPMVNMSSTLDTPWINFMSKVSKLLEMKFSCEKINKVTICSKLS